MRRFTPVELAIGVALLGSVAAVAVPTFAREFHSSRLVEATDGLARLGSGAVAHAVHHHAFPESAPLTPSTPPRGTKEEDPPGIWDTSTWTALDFRAAPEGTPHAYSFSFDSSGTGFVARARGDLDGDGILSLFEIRGSARPGEEPGVEPGMYIEAELE
jgi:hypothetical protein